LKTIVMIQETKLEKLLRYYRDIKMKALKDKHAAQTLKAKRHKSRHMMNLTNGKVQERSHKEESMKEYRDHDPKTEEYEQEARSIMVSMRADKGQQIEDTEKLIFELSQIL